jgi:SAM-dependent methyltransferase
VTAANHDDPYTVDWASQSDLLVAAATDDRAWCEAHARALVKPADRVAVDFGCGGGARTLTLATLMSDGLVVAVDVAPDLLAAASDTVVAAGASVRARVRTVLVDLDHGVEPVRTALGGSADIVWASASIHHLADQQAAISALAGLLSRGGRLALAEGGLPARHLPWDVGVGEPGLELRLDLAQDRWFARMRDALPASARMPYGWTEALHRAGLTGVCTRTTVVESSPPLTSAQTRRVIDSLRNRIDRLRGTALLDADDLAAWDVLLDPESRAWLGHRRDLFRLRARSVHIGVRS